MKTIDQETQKQCRVVLVGSTGRVGSMVRRAWEADPLSGVEAVYQTRSSVGLGHGDLAWHPLDGAKPLRAWVETTGHIDAMVVLAGIIPASGRDLFLNASIAQACIEAALSVGIKRVLLASSSAVYGVSKDGPYCEDDELHPEGEYGQSKLQMEAICEPFRDACIEICCLRIGNVAGADALLLNAGKGGIKLDQFPSGGYPVRSYIGPGCLARTLSSLVNSPLPLPHYINVAAPDSVSMKDIVEAAGVPWRSVIASEGKHESITLDCGALCGFHTFSAQDSAAINMVEEWQRLREAHDTI